MWGGGGGHVYAQVYILPYMSASWHVVTQPPPPPPYYTVALEVATRDGGHVTIDG